jgi:hypothetical protein
MKNSGELIWFLAYVVQMVALAAGFALVVTIGVTSLSEIIRRKVHRPPIRKAHTKAHTFLTESGMGL